MVKQLSGVGQRKHQEKKPDKTVGKQNPRHRRNLNTLPRPCMARNANTGITQHCHQHCVIDMEKLATPPDETTDDQQFSTYPLLGDGPIRALKGVGPQLEKTLHKLGCNTVGKLLFHLPLRHEDHTRITPIRTAQIGQSVIIEGTVESCQVINGAKRHLRCVITDPGGQLQLIFFQTAKYLQESLSPGTLIRCLGTISFFRQQKRMLHPKLMNATIPLDGQHLTPIYPLTGGLTQAKLRPLIKQAWQRSDKYDWLKEHIPAEWRESYNLPSLREALHYLHSPPQSALQEMAQNQSIETSMMARAQQRIGLEALMAHHIALASVTNPAQKKPSTPLPLSDQALATFLENFPFTPTAGQTNCLKTFQSALIQPEPMLHLLQGDVGSGKTLLAAALAYAAVCNNYQAAVMAPTELLASQHAKQFQAWFEPLGYRVALLSGRLTAAQKRDVYAEVASGEIDVVVGTHALIQPKVEFQRLAACVIDEQHRFGVEQRLTLHQKGFNPHLLLMTATPIPRSLAMTLYGNLSALELKERPAQRKPITTSILSDQKRDDLLAQIRNKCLAGEQVFWVCPLITPQDTPDETLINDELSNDGSPATGSGADIATDPTTDTQTQNAHDVLTEQDAEAAQDIGLAAETAFQEFAQKLPELSLGLVHGRMSDDEKAAVMARFRAGEHHMLIATTVIEVGIDVPNANIIVIESANRFGLSQLHQLRGRVGRGDREAYCILLYQSPLNRKGQARLQVLREQTDGFRIAEEDLNQRGPGLWLGTAQSGSMALPFASFSNAPHLIELAQSWSKRLLAHDPEAAKALRRRWHADPLRYARA